MKQAPMTMAILRIVAITCLIADTVVGMRVDTVAGMRGNSSLELEFIRELQQERQQARTDAEAQREALATFFDLVRWRWEYEGIRGTLPLTCGPHTYTGEVAGIGSGFHGVTVSMHRGNEQGPKVVAKLWKSSNKTHENLNHECAILKTLEAKGVKRVLRCEAACEHNGRPMIVVSPFMEGKLHVFTDAISVGKYYGLPNEDALNRAVSFTVLTAWHMLEVGVANTDQGHNILYQDDGEPTFIDMGLAADLERSVKEHDPSAGFVWQTSHKYRKYHVEGFLDAILAKFPSAWWKNGRALQVLNHFTKHGMPATPTYLQHEFNFAEMIQQRVDRKLSR